MSEKKRQTKTKSVNMPKAMACVMLGYVVLVILFHWLAGRQLYFRASEENIQLPAAEAGSTEMIQGAVVEQTFSVKIYLLESISVQWGTCGHADTGTAFMELYDIRKGSLLMSQSVDVSTLAEGTIITMTPEAPIETVYGEPLLLRIWADSQPGSGAAPLMNLSSAEDATEAGFVLTLNGEPTEGVLCFSASGEDRVWTGHHYWELACGFGVALALFLVLEWMRFEKGERSYVISVLTTMKKYRFLVRQLVSRDFKTRYKRSLLGIFWSLLNPLMTMAVQYVVFSTIFKNNITNFAMYLIIGVVCFSFFSEATSLALTSILGNANLITKVNVPKYIYPLTRVLSALVNLALSLIPLLLMMPLSGIVPTKACLLAPFALLCLTVFSLGIGMLLAALMVFFRDVQFIWNVLTMVWMYLTPIFYPASILPKSVVWVLDVNPIYYFITFVRTCVVDGITPEPVMYVQCFLMALGSLLVGALVFHKSQDRFVLYL